MDVSPLQRGGDPSSAEVTGSLRGLVGDKGRVMPPNQYPEPAAPPTSQTGAHAP